MYLGALGCPGAVVQEPVCNWSSSVRSVTSLVGPDLGCGFVGVEVSRKQEEVHPCAWYTSASSKPSGVSNEKPLDCMSSNIQLNYLKQTNALIALSPLTSELFHRKSCRTSLVIHIHSNLGHAVLVLPHLHALIHFSLCKLDWKVLSLLPWSLISHDSS